MKEGFETKKQSRKLLILQVGILIIILLLLLLAPLLRILKGVPLFAGGEAYYNLRIAEALRYKGFITQDSLQGTPFIPNPYHYFLSFLLALSNSDLVLLLAQLFLGLVSAFLFYIFLIRINIDGKDSIFIILLLVFIPAFLALFSSLYLLGWVIFLSLLSLNLLLSDNKLSYWFGNLSLLVLALSCQSGAVVLLGILFIVTLSLRKSPKQLLLPAVVSFLGIILPYNFSGVAMHNWGFHAFDFKNILSLLGASTGFDIFMLLLFFIGFLVLWIRHKNQRPIHLMVLVLVALSFFNSTARAYASIVSAYYCFVAAEYLYKRKWSTELIKTGILLLLVCSFVFSIANQINILVHSQPDSDLVNSLSFLKNLEPGVVLTSEDNGFFVEFYSGKQAFIDGNSFLFDDYSEKKNASETLFSIARITDAQPLLDKYRIKYILITPDMKEELWENKEIGLWFLVRNSESFDKKYFEKGIEIRQYSPKTNLTTY